MFEIEDLAALVAVGFIAIIGSLSRNQDVRGFWHIVATICVIARAPVWLGHWNDHRHLRRLQRLGRDEQNAVINSVFDDHVRTLISNALREDMPTVEGVGHERFKYPRRLRKWTDRIHIVAILVAFAVLVQALVLDRLSLVERLAMGGLVIASVALLIQTRRRHRITHQVITISPGDIVVSDRSGTDLRIPWNEVQFLRWRRWLRRIEIHGIGGRRVLIGMELVGFDRALALSLSYGPFGLGGGAA